MKHLGILKYFLELLGARPVHFPMEQNHRLGSSTSTPLQDVERYWWLVGVILIGLVVLLPDVQYLVVLCDYPISWKTKKQVIVSHSSTEAEYRSMTVVTCELKWLKRLVKSLGVDYPQRMDLKCDSQSALYLAHNPVFHEYTKHIEIDCHFLRDAILEGTIRTSHVSTHEQLADIFTKSLGRRQFEFLLRKLGIHDFHTPT
ncbi:hypothetical protein LIER_23868 [Lithospermum erythrorhizon]|uniref:Retrovirus-related Pol polyprotein from transposon RE1 n=1 Tax=Lithospermum erythrorhizon TaxID=34254 RepID=A0AAV3QZ97_LITER